MIRLGADYERRTGDGHTALSLTCKWYVKIRIQVAFV
jgi:hypothetical protein